MPKIAFVAGARDYTASSGKQVNASDIDLNVRALSMGKLHHAMRGTAAAAIATAAAIPGTLMNLAAGGGERSSAIFGNPFGTLKVGARGSRKDGEWTVDKVMMSRSARVLSKAGFVSRATHSDLCPALNLGRSRCQARYCHGCPCPRPNVAAYT